MNIVRLIQRLTADLAAALALVLVGLPLQAGEPALIPSSVVLDGAGARQRLVVERTQNGLALGELTDAVTLESSAPDVVRVEGSTLVPVANGTAVISARHGPDTARAQVRVTGMDRPFAWSFRNHVQPVLARTGCSSGACHGAAAGQNGFRLSLRGYDNDGDHLSLTRHVLGRRIVPEDPGRSLVLLKASGAVPHKGGKRFEPDSLEYRVLSEWIAAGTPGPSASDARIEGIEILPPGVRLAPGDHQQLLVRARFSDGRVEDVTHWAKFTAANADVAVVDDAGRVSVTGQGEGAVTAWYLSRIAIARVTVPFTNTVAPRVFARAPKRNFIDEQVTAKLRDLNLPPSPRSTDEEFIRRLFLDTLGVLPAADEARAFAEDRGSRKRDQWIDRVLARPEFVDYWAYKWSDLLLVQTRKLKPRAMWAYHDWIRRQVAANTPWDQFVRQIVTATGSTLENGAGNFFVLHEDPRLMAETTSQAFLGMSINCARCHNHPMEKWTNDEYFGFANLFARLRMKAGPGGDGDQVLFAVDRGDVLQPLTGKPQPPRPLDGTALALDDPDDRRDALAQWLVSPDNPYFSRAIVNRVWANFFGRGLVDPVDDLRVTNPASHEELLAQSAAFLAGRKYDLKALMREILRSETYQRSSVALPENSGDSRFYSRYYPRRLRAEVLLDALSQVTGVPTQFGSFPEGWRALQLPDANVDSYFLKAFGRPERNVTCECERTDAPSITQVLHLANGDTLNRKLTSDRGRLAKWISEKTASNVILDDLYLSAFSRLPTDSERKQLSQSIESAPPEERRAALEDIVWAVLSSREFLFTR